jgi:hypothetical protein
LAFASVSFFLMSQAKLYAQPANDACAGAAVVIPNGACVNGTTVAAGDSWQGTVGCQIGNNNSNHPDVWYSFTATGTQATIAVTAGTFLGNVEVVLVEGTCTGTFALTGSLCGTSPLTATFNGLLIGTTYYYTVSNVPTGTPGTFTTCVTNTTPPVASGQDCGTGAILCNSAPFSQGSSTAGAGSVFGNSSSENLSALGCLAQDERQSKWYKFTVGCTGTISFLINPNTNTDDYDWAIYDITTSGCNLTPGGLATGGATQVACNFSGCPGNTGIVPLGVDPCTLTNFTGCANNPSTCEAGDVLQFVTVQPTLTAGRTYAMVIDNFSLSNAGFAFTWTAGTAVIGPDAFFTYTAGSCGSFTFNKTCQITPSTNSVYLWTFGDGSTSTLQNPTHTYSSPGTYNVSLTVTDLLGCSETTSQTLVYNTPTGSATPSSQTICSGNTTNILLSSSTVGTTYSWTVVQSGVTGASASSGNTISQVLTNTSLTNGTATYTITPTAAGCNGTPFSVTITVLPLSTASYSGSTSICSGNTTSINLTSNILGTTYSWTATNSGASGGTAGSGSSIAQPLIATGASVGTVTYSITPNSGGCPGNPLTIIASVVPAPVASFSGVTTICSGTPLSIVLSSNTSGTTFNWTASSTNVDNASSGSGTSIGQTLTASTTSNGTVVYTVTPTANGCPGSPITITVTVKPNPVTSFSGPTSICSGNTTSIVLTSTVSGTTFSWSSTESFATGSSPGSGNSIAQTLSASSTSPGIVTYTVTPTANSCPGSPINIAVTVNPAPVGSFTGITTICSGTSTALSLNSNVAGATYSWTISQSGTSGASGGSGNSIAQTLLATTSTPGTVNYTVTPSFATCNGSPFPIVVTVNPTPVINFSGATTICSGNTTALNLTSSVSGTVFSWTQMATNATGSSDGSGTSIGQTLSNGSTTTGSVTYNVSGTANGCPGTAISILVTVNPRPSASFSGVTTICTGTALALSLSSTPSGSTFSWTATPTGVSGSSSGSGLLITNTLNNSGNIPAHVLYTVTPTLSGCGGTPIVIDVTVNPRPNQIVTGATTICSGATTALNLSSSVVGTSFTWTQTSSGVSGSINGNGSSISQTLLATGLTAGTVVYTISSSANGCPGNGTSVTVTVNPTPVGSFTGDTQICSGSQLTISLQSTILGTTFSWIAPSIGLIGAASGSGNTIIQTLTTTSSSNGTANYTITPTLGTCIGTSFAFSVLVIPNASAPSLSPNPFCSGTITVLSSSSTGSLYEFVVNGSSLGAPSTSSSYSSLTPLAGENICVRAYMNASAVLEGCYAETCRLVETTLTPNFNDLTVCYGVTSPLISTSPNGVTGSWSPVFDPTQTGAYTFTPNSEQCATNQTINVVVSPLIDSGPILHD